MTEEEMPENLARFAKVFEEETEGMTEEQKRPIIEKILAVTQQESWTELNLSESRQLVGLCPAGQSFCCPDYCISCSYTLASRNGARMLQTEKPVSSTCTTCMKGFTKTAASTCQCVGDLNLTWNTCKACAKNAYFNAVEQRCIDCYPYKVSSDKLSCQLPCDPGNYWVNGGCTECIGDVDSKQLKCHLCDKNDYFNDALKKCVPCIGTVSEDTKVCKDCAAHKNFDVKSKTCQDCYGDVSADFLTCTACNADGSNQFFNTAELECTQCDGALEDVNYPTYPTGCDECTTSQVNTGTACVDCVGTIGTEVRENVCIIECDANLYFKNGACVDCYGKVSADFLTCDACPTADDQNQYFDTDASACTECVGVLEDVIYPTYPTGCAECTTDEYFNVTTPACAACGDTILLLDGTIVTTCPNCVGTFTSADLICSPCVAPTPAFYQGEYYACAATCFGVVNANGVCEACPAGQWYDASVNIAACASCESPNTLEARDKPGYPNACVAPAR